MSDAAHAAAGVRKYLPQIDELTAAHIPAAAAVLVSPVIVGMVEVMQRRHVAAAVRGVVGGRHSDIYQRMRVEQSSSSMGRTERWRSPHFPNMCVLYPAAAIFMAMPVMLRGIAAMPETGSAGLKISGPALSGFCGHAHPSSCGGQLTEETGHAASRRHNGGGERPCGCTHDVVRVATALDRGARRGAVLVDICQPPPSSRRGSSGER